MDKKKIYHAAVYVRLSKEDDDIAVSGKVESDSISNQKSLIHNFINGHDDIVLTKEYVDDGYSGANFDRPQFQMMLADIKQGIIDCVIVKDLSRFGREYIDSGMYIERLFPSLGVRFIAINDQVDSLDDDRNDIILPFKNLMNDAYCRDISIKIRSHLDVKRRNGEYVSSFVTYGYMKSETDKHVIVPDPYAADVVRMIFRMKLNGKSHERIADYLNNEGILSPAEYKHSRGIHIQDHFKTHEQAMWSAMAVRRILGNDIYIGVLTQGIRSTPNNKVKQSFIKEKKDWVRIEDNHEAIIDKHSFSVVQKLLDQDLRTAHEEENVYPLAGVMVCADCGSVMVRQDMSNIIAGIVRGQFEYIDEHISRKKEIYERYKEGFKDLPVEMNPFQDKIAKPNYWLSCMIINKDAMCKQVRSENEALYISEQGKSCPTEILETLAKYNAEGRPIWKPMHMQPIYRLNPFITKNGNGRARTNAYIEGGCEDAGMNIFERGLCLPSDIKMPEE